MVYDFTPSPELPSLHEHPLYKSGMAQIAAGQWQQAFESLQLLQDIYRGEAEVKELLDQVQMRAALAQFQPRQSSRTTKHLNARRLVVAALAMAVITVAAYVAYEVWINPVIAQEFRLRQVTQLRHEADEAIEAGDYVQARQSLQKLQAIVPGDRHTLDALHRIEQVERSATLYTEANALVEAGSWDQAIEVLTELQNLDAEYRDLPQLLQLTQESRAMDKQFQTAGKAFADGEWANAIAQYESLREANLAFRFEEVQAQLFESHLRYGQALLEESGTDPNLVSEAASHFSQALKLEPMDAGVLRERHLAEIYLAALDSESQNEVINLLQIIYAESPEYAGKQAAQLLYATLIERADSLLESGEETAALADYQAAAQLLVDDPSEAQEKLAGLVSETTP